ncbi:MAG: thiamine diphosphokinase [Verrucomicrobia bacterium]|nr:thiamine diphosphokinase [Verrucomicrobiota bacterium]MBU6446797.1 thiamine diphosphokinase [Verrucomicrobiota bacterium]MDE3048200.1 thiamine diphosphokinase [Verrucomicrobiota bacterium]
MTTAIVANGQIDSPTIIRSLILRHNQIIAVDGGLVHCDKMGIQPHLIVGDFDSCPPELQHKYAHIRTILLKKDKDETDLEAAIREAHAKDTTLYAAWGYRIDHSLTNALLLTRYPGMKMETETEIVFAVDQAVQLHCKVGQTLSLIPLNGPVTGITTSGLKWELKSGKLDSHFIGISNVCVSATIQISVKSGSLLCVLQR